MGMIRSLANRTKAGAANVNEYGALLEGRVLALARVQRFSRAEPIVVVRYEP